jgi:hypothetical protein
MAAPAGPGRTDQPTADTGVGGHVRQICGHSLCRLQGMMLDMCMHVCQGWHDDRSLVIVRVGTSGLAGASVIWSCRTSSSETTVIALAGVPSKQFV